ncbi:orotidine-5'-phosphate decarboxylase [Actinocorallia herbida]|uniref:Orotidine 5'-phosphate decarboxylase n=1 Tax=Actinocorallia herbida TaxID=58109 RepID=A0A3N1CRG0_9ACTN|nr:orotidine-5'-phosphate decarboxylase [Actinocorallia herbida]ROO83901.1 orotidine-5'-phosphate decarboxylase [Actinocorallia herbida]
MKPAPIAVALDTDDIATAVRWTGQVAPHVSTVKVGLELYLRYGREVVTRVREAGGERLFLDLKLHDIPATVEKAVRAVADLTPAYLTVHASGGTTMIKAAAAAAPETKITAVTVLTSMGEGDLAEIGLAGPADDAVRRLAALAVGAGARALVCSPREVALVRAEVGAGIDLITPGVRPAGSAADDQTRIATPESALAAGADLLVIGRPITRDSDPGRAAAEIAAALRAAG